MKLIFLGIGAVFFGCAIYFWVRAAIHMIGLINNFKPSMRWMRFVPFCIFFSECFTEKGNIHRMAMFRYAGLFVLFCAAPFIIAGSWMLLERLGS